MVISRLHIICGNCGQMMEKDWSWDYEPEEKDEESGEVFNSEDVNIYCRNCSTLHSLEKTRLGDEY